GRQVRTAVDGEQGTVLPATRNASLQTCRRTQLVAPQLVAPWRLGLARANPERTKPARLHFLDEKRVGSIEIHITGARVDGIGVSRLQAVLPPRPQRVR